MFDIGFSELLLVMVIGLVVLGPERLPVAVRTVANWIKTLRSLASTVQSELSQELKLQELQASLKKVEKASLQNLSPELKASMDELKEAAEAMKRGYPPSATDEGQASQTPANQPLDDPEAVYDGVIDTERAPSLIPSAHTQESRPIAPAQVAENKPKSEQPPAVSPHQISDDR
ncbi:Sec-independent protein translocase protein TatB [Brenneria rubrifaciens]|uniref:Sec-independent protein translocase protein TatB n=1 Tax=Brenneria rubrifaciens TaxID=55213 RepID=A0A4P8QZK4_9GAMM|nr:Sec-independent protein translocase protein TatB [Brenneria rubrifaciens]QCR09745.1 Sec-independent protein translocase subunit TatB [Brenneria rubrifaciens]